MLAGGNLQTGPEWLEMPILEDGLSNLLSDDDFQVQDWSYEIVHFHCASQPDISSVVSFKPEAYRSQCTPLASYT